MRELPILKQQSKIKPTLTSVVFHTDTSHLIHTANQLSGFHMKCTTGLKWVTLK